MVPVMGPYYDTAITQRLARHPEATLLTDLQRHERFLPPGGRQGRLTFPVVLMVLVFVAAGVFTQSDPPEADRAAPADYSSRP